MVCVGLLHTKRYIFRNIMYTFTMVKHNMNINHCNQQLNDLAKF